LFSIAAQKPRARTLSSSSKKKSNEQSEIVDSNADAIFKAMAIENQTIGNKSSIWPCL